MDRDVEDGWLLLDGKAAQAMSGAEDELRYLVEEGDVIIDLTKAQSGVPPAAHLLQKNEKKKKAKKSGNGLFGFGLAKDVGNIFAAGPKVHSNHKRVEEQ